MPLIQSQFLKLLDLDQGRDRQEFFQDGSDGIFWIFICGRKRLRLVEKILKVVVLFKKAQAGCKRCYGTEILTVHLQDNLFHLAFEFP